MDHLRRRELTGLGLAGPRLLLLPAKPSVKAVSLVGSVAVFRSSFAGSNFTASSVSIACLVWFLATSLAAVVACVSGVKTSTDCATLWSAGLLMSASISDAGVVRPLRGASLRLAERQPF